MPPDLPVLTFASRDDWAGWLAEHHATAGGVWLRLPKKGAATPSVTRAEALEEALCWGWIDGQARSEGAGSWLQKFTPRRPRSTWSKVNREKVQALIDAGRMRPAGLREVERARADGRWDAAYDAQSAATVPPDLQAALDASPGARAAFAALDARNRYAILHRLQTPRRAETRARRLTQFVAMLERGERLHP